MNVILWWCFMTFISILNIMIILFQYKNIKSNFEMELFFLAFIFVLVNAIRSIWLRRDTERICFFNTYISSPLLGRMLATISELCFVRLIILVFKKIIYRTDKNSNLNILLDGIFIAIVLAEIFSWRGCLTTNQKWNVIEESIWAFSSVVITFIAIILINKEKNHSIKKFLYYIIIATVLYETFMLTVDIPMYQKRCKNYSDYLSIKDGILDMKDCKKISKKEEDWKEDAPWFTGYFTAGSWGAIILLVWYQHNRKLFSN